MALLPEQRAVVQYDGGHFYWVWLGEVDLG